MRRLAFVLVCALGICSCTSTKMDIDKTLKKSEQQFSVLLASAYEQNKIPRSLDEHGDVEWVNRSMDWTEGFFPGILWKLYEHSNDPKWKDAADHFQTLYTSDKDKSTTHDLGFIFQCSYGEGYKLTHNDAYKQVVVDASDALIAHYDSVVGCIKSLDFGKEKWTFPVIIDNMLNLEMLFEASEITGNDVYRDVAISHANVTLKNHFRDDYSCCHVVDYNPENGSVYKKITHQGYNHESSWARGHQYKNKALLIDFWIPSCGPCLMGMSKTTQLRKDTKDLPIEYVFICSRARKEDWMKKMDNRKVSGTHLLLNGTSASELQEMFSVSAYPTYVFIDKHGKYKPNVVSSVSFPDTAGIAALIE